MIERGKKAHGAELIPLYLHLYSISLKEKNNGFSDGTYFRALKFLFLIKRNFQQEIINHTFFI